MDAATRTTMANGTMEVLKPHLSALAAQDSAQGGARVPPAVGRLWGVLRSRLGARPGPREALGQLLSSPDDPQAQAAFRAQLMNALQADPGFAQSLRTLLPDAQAQARQAGADPTSAGEGSILIPGEDT